MEIMLAFIGKNERFLRFGAMRQLCRRHQNNNSDTQNRRTGTLNRDSGTKFAAGYSDQTTFLEKLLLDNSN